MTGDENLEPRFDLACLGEPMLELNLQTSSSPRLYLEAHGGDACNVAVAAARQGLRTVLVSAIGVDPAGWSFRELWAREGIDAEAVQVDPEAPTGLYFVSHDTTGHHFSYLRGGSAASRHRLDAAARSVLTRSRMIFASGISLGISEIAAETVFEALSVVRSCGGTVAFDTNYRPKLWAKEVAALAIRRAMGQADILFPGLEDAELLFGLSDPDVIVDLCLSAGARVVVLKMGSAGALLATPSARFAVAPFPCQPIDATGAGDTFCGAFLARFADGDQLEAAARHAACAAALSTTGYGAVPSLPSRLAVLAALRDFDLTRADG